MKHWTAGLAAALVFSVPAAAEVVASSDAGFVIRLSTEVTAKPDDAWKELVTPADWWNKDHTFSGDAANLYIDGQATGCFCEKLPAPKDAPAGRRPGSVEHMRIVYVDPGKVLRMNGALGPLQSEALDGTLTITLKPVAGKTRILWEYVVGGYMRYKPDEIAPAVNKVLGEQLESLAAKLGPVAPPTPTKGAGAKGAAGKSGATPKVSDPKFLDDSAEEAPPEAPAKAEEEKPAAPKAAGRRRAPKDDKDYVEPTR
ncbi:MAG TPA: SRPBCC family protein [Sphingomicrobium sp.]